MNYFILSLLIFKTILFSSDTLEKVSVQFHWRYQYEFAGFIAAKEKGFYKDVGLDVELKEYKFGQNIVNDVIKGDSTYGIYNSNILLSYLKNKQIKLVASFFKRPALVIITKPNIKSPSELINKTVMAATKNDFDFNFKYIFDQQKIDTNKLNFISHSYNIQDFINGKCDAMTAYISDQPYKLNKLGIKYNIIDPSNYGIYNLQLELFTSKEEVINHYNRVLNFKKATIKGWEYALNNIDDIVDIIDKKYNRGISKEALKYEALAIKKLILPKIYPIGSFDKNFLIKQQEIIKNEYNINGDLKIEDFLLIVDKKELLQLTNKEQKYLKRKKIIKMCNNQNLAPIEFINNGIIDGIAIDTIKLIEEKLNIKIEHIPTKDWIQSQQFLKDRKCDILSSTVKTIRLNNYANFTKSYIKLPLAIFTTKDKIIVSGLDAVKDKTLIIQKDSILISKLKKEYPLMKIIKVESDTEALQFLNSGKAYFSISNLPVASYSISKYMLNDLQISGYTSMEENLRIAVRSDDKILLSILNKTLDNISNNISKTIMQNWVNSSIKETIIDYNLVWKILAIAVIIILGVLIAYKKQEVLKNEIENLNNSLENRVKQEIEKNRKKEKILLHQNRLAQMGEMISMIAHQWRQPLSAISSTSGSIKLKAKMDNLDNNTAIELSTNILTYSHHLSTTIDDFRNFFKINKNKKDTTYNDIIESVLNIVEVSIKNKNITLEKELKSNLIFNSYPNELKQVILNLIKNAEDILLEKDIKNPKIIISTKDNILSISDNAGGIPKDIIDKIFDPYFSTKKDLNGTGIGLYMSKIIIEDHCGGSLRVLNNKEGAVFIIKLGVKND